MSDPLFVVRRFFGRSPCYLYRTPDAELLWSHRRRDAEKFTEAEADMVAKIHNMMLLDPEAEVVGAGKDEVEA